MRIAIVVGLALFAVAHTNAQTTCPEGVSQSLQGGSWTETAGEPSQPSFTLHKLIASESGVPKATVEIKAEFVTHKRWKPNSKTAVKTETKCVTAYPNTKHHWGVKLEKVEWTYENIDGSGSFDGKATDPGNVYLCTDGSEFRIAEVSGEITGGTGKYANVTSGEWTAKPLTVFREQCSNADGCPTLVGKFTASFVCGP